MSRKIEILDCTLRDGGYVNNWSFHYEDILSVIRALQKSNIEHIEIGYLGLKKQYNKNSTWFNSFIDLTLFLGEATPRIETKSNLFVMVNHGDYPIEKFPTVTSTILDIGIRYAFHINDYEDALKNTKQLIEKGYKICVQPMITLLYSDIEILKLLDLVNTINPYALYIVDSFGNLYQDKLHHIFNLYEFNLNNNIKIGLHLHNNMQLAFSNAIKFIEISKSHDILIDSSVYGMGRGAGNLNTEIITNFLNRNYEKKYDNTSILQVIDNTLDNIYQKTSWGYTVAHYLSAETNCHPNYAGALVNKKTLTITDIRKILLQVPNENKYSFDKNVLENIYSKHLNKIKSKPNFNFNFPQNKEILIIASGSNYKKQYKLVKQFKEKNEHLAIAVNHIPENTTCDFYFFSNQQRFFQYAHKIQDKSKIVITPNIENNLDNLINVIQKKTEHNVHDSYLDNVTITLLNILKVSGIKKAFIAGFDGYSDPFDLYSYKESSHTFNKAELLEQNTRILEYLKTFTSNFKLTFITDSIFKKTCNPEIIGIIPARFKSSRFEGKPLANIAGKAMIERTYNQSIKAKGLSKVLVATDDSKIYDFCKSKNIPVEITSENCKTGTDRIAELSEKIYADLYINIQGDEPVINPASIDLVIDEYKKEQNSYIAYNLYSPITEKEEITSDTIIKVIVNEKDELMYMSRLPVPFTKSNKKPIYNKQICVYGFTRQSLEMYKSNKGVNEKYEDIELLRLVDSGEKVKMIHSEYSSIAVDIPTDIEKVEKFLQHNPDFN